MGKLDADDKKFQKWLDLREQFRDAKREKNPEKIISVCQKVIELDRAAKYIKILVPLFEKDMAKAYKGLGQNAESLTHYKKALQGYIDDSSPWTKEIASIEKTIAKLEKDTLSISVSG